MRTKKSYRQIVVLRCPGCGHEVEQRLMGTQHTSGMSCIPCETGMEYIPLEESQYDYDDELIENGGEYEMEYEVPDSKDEIERIKEQLEEDSE